MENSDILCEKSAAEYLSISLSTLKRMRYFGELSWYVVGRQIRYSRSKHLDQFLQKCERVGEDVMGLEP